MQQETKISPTIIFLPNHLSMGWRSWIFFHWPFSSPWHWRGEMVAEIETIARLLACLQRGGGLNMHTLFGLIFLHFSHFPLFGGCWLLFSHFFWKAFSLLICISFPFSPLFPFSWLEPLHFTPWKEIYRIFFNQFERCYFLDPHPISPCSSHVFALFALFFICLLLLHFGTFGFGFVASLSFQGIKCNGSVPGKGENMQKKKYNQQREKCLLLKKRQKKGKKKSSSRLNKFETANFFFCKIHMEKKRPKKYAIWGLVPAELSDL